MYYIGSKTQCEYYLNKVNEGENYNGVTSKWADIVQHPTNNEFAIVKHEDYTHSSMILVNELPNDWQTQEDI